MQIYPICPSHHSQKVKQDKIELGLFSEQCTQKSHTLMQFLLNCKDVKNSHEDSTQIYIRCQKAEEMGSLQVYTSI